MAVYLYPGAGKGLRIRAEKLARQTGLPLTKGPEKYAAELYVAVTEQGLGLISSSKKRTKEKMFIPDWLKMDLTSAAGRNMQQPLIKAILGKKARGRKLIIWDCTAGFGEDVWIMACLGFSVVAVEKNSIVFSLLRDTRGRAGVVSPFAARRIRLIHADAILLLQQMAKVNSASLAAGSAQMDLLPPPDVVYLDPMFPGHARRKTAERKAMRLLRQILAQEVLLEHDLFQAALQVAKKRVVVKRPLHASPLNGVSPVHQVRGKAVRFDVYS